VKVSAHCTGKKGNFLIEKELFLRSKDLLLVTWGEKEGVVTDILYSSNGERGRNCFDGKSEIGRQHLAIRKTGARLLMTVERSTLTCRSQKKKEKKTNHFMGSEKATRPGENEAGVVLIESLPKVCYGKGGGGSRPEPVDE